MFFYRYMLFSFILRNIKNIFVKLSFLLVFLYFSSFIFIAMKEGISVAFAYKDPKNVAIYVYKYLKWCYYNPELVTYSIIFKTCVSLGITFFAYLKISKINWNNFSKSLCKYVSSIFKKDTYNTQNLENNSNSNNYNTTQIDYREEIYNIKKDAMMSIEKSINKMISEILCVRDKKIRGSCDNVNNDKD